MQRHLLIPLLALGPTSCSGSNVAEEMERGLRLANDAIAISLFASEGVAWVDSKDTGHREIGEIEHGVARSAPGPRHGVPTNCPKLARDPDEGEPFTVTATYGSGGCVSGSRLVPATLYGKILVIGDGDTLNVDPSGVQIGLVRYAEGSFAGTREGTRERYAVSGTVGLPESGDRPAFEAELHIAIDHTIASEVAFDGHVLLDTDLGKERVDLDNVVIHIEDVSGECPLPYKGTARLGRDSELSVDFRRANDDGRVLVTRGRRTSTPTRLCSFASDVF